MIYILFGFFTQLFYQLLYQVLIAWPKKFLEGIEQMIMKLSSQELLDYVLLGSQENQNGIKLPPILFYFTIASGFLITILLIINLIVSHLYGEPTKMRQKMIESFKNAFKAGILIITIPILFLLINFIIGGFQKILIIGLNHYSQNNSNVTITNLIHDMGWVNGKKGVPGWTDFSNNYNPIVVIFGLIFFAINLFKLGIVFLMRILELSLLFFLAPFVAAKMSSDGGKAFNRWKEIVISKFLMVLGIILSISISTTTITLLINSIEAGYFPTLVANNLEKTALKLFIVLAGSTFMLVAYQYIDIITGGNTSLQQGQLFVQQMGHLWQGMIGSAVATNKALGFVHKNKPALNNGPGTSDYGSHSGSSNSPWKSGLAGRTGLVGMIGTGLTVASYGVANIAQKYKNRINKLDPNGSGKNLTAAKKIKTAAKTIALSPISATIDGAKIISQKAKNVSKSVKKNISKNTIDVYKTAMKKNKKERNK